MCLTYEQKLQVLKDEKCHDNDILNDKLKAAKAAARTHILELEVGRSGVRRRRSRINFLPTPTRRMRRIIPLRRTTIDAEAELTRLLVEEIIEESVSNLREYTDEEYPDQAG